MLKIPSLFKQVDAAPLGLFRFCFGFILLIQSIFIFNDHFIKENFIYNYYHFPFDIFGWLHLEKLSVNAIYTLFGLMTLGTLGIMTGLCFRLACWTYIATLGYMVIYEKALALDHYYLMLLITFLLSFTDANRWPALNTLRFKKIDHQTIPYWQLLILRLQLAVVYFYATLNKINVDWVLYAEPVHRILSKKILFGAHCDQLWLAYLFSWGSILLDGALTVCYLSGRFKKIAIISIILFHGGNIWIFNDIGFFPYLMIICSLLMLEPKPSPQRNTFSPLYQNFITPFFIAYLTVQILIPLRQWIIYPQGNTAWTYEGSRFSWRLKLNTKLPKIKVFVLNQQTGENLLIDHTKLLTPAQTWFDNMPDMMPQFARYLKKDFERIGIPNAAVKMEIYASLNNRPYQLYIDPNINLAEVNYPLFSHASWIIPLKDERTWKEGWRHLISLLSS